MQPIFPNHNILSNESSSATTSSVGVSDIYFPRVSNAAFSDSAYE